MFLPRFQNKPIKTLFYAISIPGPYGTRRVTAVWSDCSTEAAGTFTCLVTATMTSILTFESPRLTLCTTSFNI